MYFVCTILFINIWYVSHTSNFYKWSGWGTTYITSGVKYLLTEYVITVLTRPNWKSNHHINQHLHVLTGVKCTCTNVYGHGITVKIFACENKEMYILTVYFTGSSLWPLFTLTSYLMTMPFMGRRDLHHMPSFNTDTLEIPLYSIWIW